MQYLSLSFDDLRYVEIEVRLKQVEGHLLFYMEPSVTRKPTTLPSMSCPPTGAIDAGRLYSAYSVDFQTGHDHKGPFLRAFTSLDASRLINPTIPHHAPILYPHNPNFRLPQEGIELPGGIPVPPSPDMKEFFESFINPSLPPWGYTPQLGSDPIKDKAGLHPHELSPGSPFGDGQVSPSVPSSSSLSRSSSPNQVGSPSPKWIPDPSDPPCQLPESSVSQGDRGEDSEGKVFPCGVCPRRLKSQHTLKAHMEAHNHKHKRPTLFTCTHGCSEQFTRQHDRLRHEVAKHGKVCDWLCDDCKRFFSSKKTLAHHKCPMMAGGTRWVY